MIRPSTKAEVPSLIRLSEDSGLFPSDHLDVLQEMLNDYFESGDRQERFWLTDDEDRAVGVAYCEPELMTNGTWNLRLIAVHPELQGQGRGSKMVAHVEQLLSARGARILLVDTSGTVEFEPVRRFYQKCGYTEEARIPDYFDEGDDKITFSKRLAR